MLVSPLFLWNLKVHPVVLDPVGQSWVSIVLHRNDVSSRGNIRGSANSTTSAVLWFRTRSTVVGVDNILLLESTTDGHFSKYLELRWLHKLANHLGAVSIHLIRTSIVNTFLVFGTCMGHPEATGNTFTYSSATYSKTSTNKTAKGCCLVTRNKIDVLWTILWTTVRPKEVHTSCLDLRDVDAFCTKNKVDGEVRR